MKKNIIKISKSVLILFMTSIIILACDSSAGDGKNLLKGDVGTSKNTKVEFPKASDVINNWPDKNKMTAQEMIKKYGEPKSVANDRLIWENNGMWRTTIVYKDQLQHNFPVPHTDYLEQSIDYKVPVNKFDDLAIYDGSIIAERTKGTLSARCDKEELNILAMNLADDVIKGRKTTDQARQAFTKMATNFMNGQENVSTQELQFTVNKGETSDPDKSMKDKMKESAKNKGKKKDAGSDMSKGQTY